MGWFGQERGHALAEPLGQPDADPGQPSALLRVLVCPGPLTLNYPSFKFPSLSYGGVEASAAPGLIRAEWRVFLTH